MGDPTRQELVERGRAVLAQLEHGTRPPRTRPLHLGSVAGLDRYTAEALWGSVWTRPVLDLRDRTLITLAVLSALQRLPQLRTYLNSARNIGIGVHEIEEVLIQCSVYVGFPATVNALELLREVLEVRDDSPTPPEESGQSRQEPTALELEERGGALRSKLFGTVTAGQSLRQTADDEQAADDGTARAVLERIELRYVFGQIYERPDLELRVRVMCAVAMLVALRDPEELERWIGAAYRIGLDQGTVEEVILQVAYYAGFPAARQAMQVVARVAGPVGPAQP